MNRLILLLAILFTTSLLQSSVHAQSESYHSIVVKTQSITPGELNQFAAEIQNQFKFRMAKACLDEGFILVEVPTSLAVRINQAEDSILSAAAAIWNNDVSIAKDVTLEQISQCAD